MMAPSGTGCVIWVTGLSGAGKSTVSRLVVEGLGRHGIHPVLLDGDELRRVLALEAFDRESRRKIAYGYSDLCGLIADQGHTVVCATIALYHEIHKRNRNNFPRYLEVYLDVPMDQLKKRDRKGVYQAARDVWGVELRPEIPLAPDLVIRNHAQMTPEVAAEQIIERYLQEEPQGS
jgi:cytidine diphosphoramidate kinase